MLGDGEAAGLLQSVNHVQFPVQTSLGNYTILVTRWRYLAVPGREAATPTVVMGSWERLRTSSSSRSGRSPAAKTFSGVFLCMVTKHQHYLWFERLYSLSLQLIIGNESIDIEVSISMPILFRLCISIGIDDTFKVGIDIEYRRYF